MGNEGDSKYHSNPPPEDERGQGRSRAGRYVLTIDFQSIRCAQLRREDQEYSQPRALLDDFLRTHLVRRPDLRGARQEIKPGRARRDNGRRWASSSCKQVVKERDQSFKILGIGDLGGATAWIQREKEGDKTKLACFTRANASEGIGKQSQHNKYMLVREDCSQVCVVVVLYFISANGTAGNGCFRVTFELYLLLMNNNNNNKVLLERRPREL